MRKRVLVLTILSALTLGCDSDNRASLAQDFLRAKIAGESEQMLSLKTFQKTNGYAQELVGTKMYVLEWQAQLSVLRDVWKAGNALIGYWQSFGVLPAQPDGMTNMLVGGTTFIEGDSLVNLSGECLFRETDNGWRVETCKVKGSQLIPRTATIADFVGDWGCMGQTSATISAEGTNVTIETSLPVRQVYHAVFSSSGTVQGSDFTLKLVRPGELAGDGNNAPISICAKMPDRRAPSSAPVESAPPANASPTSTGPSFDCAKATTPVEHAICGDQELAILERQMADAYRRRVTIDGRIKAAHAAWFKEYSRTCNAIGADADRKACIRQFLGARIQALGNGR